MLASAALSALAGLGLATAPDAPSFRLPSARDLTWISKDDFAGQVLFIDVSRSTCARSASFAPAVNDLRRQYHSRGLEILTVYDELAGTPDDPFERVLTDAERKGFKHPIAVNDGSEFHAGYYRQVRSTPSAFLVSRSGKVEFLGADPLDEGRLASTRERIEVLLAEAAPVKADREERATLKPFSALLYSGGVVRASDLTGRPTVVVAWTAGTLMDRLAPSLERVQKRVANRARVLAITFSDFDSGLTAASMCPSVAMAAPDSRAYAALGAGQLPQILFIDSKGRLAARISTLYGAYGVEEKVIERLTRCLLAEDGVDIGDGRATTLVYDAKNAVSFVLPAEFRAAGLDKGALEFVAAGTDPRKPPKVRGRIVSEQTGDEAIARAKIAAATSCPNYKVESEERTRNGGVLLSERWDDGGRAIRGMRLFVNTPKGLLEIDASGLTGDLTQRWDQLRSAAQSVVVGR